MTVYADAEYWFKNNGFRKIDIDREVSRSGGGSSGGGVFYDEFWSYGLADEKNWKPGQQRKQIDVGIDAFTGEVRNYNAFTATTRTSRVVRKPALRTLHQMTGTML